MAPPFPNGQALLHAADATKTTAENVKDLLIGQSTFADFDLDGRIDHLIPVCVRKDCGPTARFHMWLQAANKWVDWAVNLTGPPGKPWSFVDRDSAIGDSGKMGIEGVTFRAGDFSRDGYVDIVGILQNGSSPSNRFAFLLENRPCMRRIEGKKSLLSSKDAEEPCKEANNPRVFEVHWDPLAGQSQVTTVGFIDLSEDGSLDVILESPDSSSGKASIGFVEASDKGDTCFLRAQVFTGLCARKTCPGHREGSGLALPGACLYYESVDPDGHKRKGAECQQSQSTHRSLQLPYALFGLGQSPNFVDFLEVAVPAPQLERRSFPQIMPNSRLYVIPHPINNTSKWIYRLYVTPSRLILLSFATLSCVCGVILFIIVVLQIQEKRADKRERLQEAHKFHFDAM